MKQLPSYVTRYFWGDNLGELDIQKHRKYLLQTLLEKGDQRAIKWLFSTIRRESIINDLVKLKLSKKSANFWSIYLS